ncbi:uncharacterized protein [Littorina saxatilis]|uniref:uncharacterized protein n=1 Tax=Littorina saxatilis TaxID=31220 RepID=UPI0038B5F215
MLPRLSTSDDTHRFSTTSLRSASPTSILQSTFLAGGEDCPSSNHHFSSSLSSVDHENDPQSTSLNSREDCVLDTSEDLSSSNIDRDALHHAPSKGRFMSIDQLVDAVKTMSDHCVKQIPPGNKDNTFCLIDNSVNLEQWNARHRAAYVDDCGAYDSSVGTTVNRYFVLESNKAKSVYKKNGEYATESRKIVNKKTTQEWIPLNPQPNPEDVITGHFVYSKLRSDPSFKKRVTTFSGHSSTFCKPVAVVEYCGIHPGHNQPHGNRKHHGNPYCRTQHTVLSEAAKRAKNQPPRHVYMDMNKENSFDAPSNAKQIRNKKHNEKAANRENRPNGQNVADEVLETIAMLNTQNSVQQIIHCKGKIPSLIVYNKQQMEDLKANCVGENGSVIGFDRTFNVGPCFITPTTYKNKAVWHSESNEHPLMLGPTFLHWDGEFETYHTFISHLKRELQSEDIVVGSDAEKALTKALQLEFPSATHLLCTIHMKDITRYLSEKVGCSMRDRTEIISFIFGEAGIAWADDSATSEFREDRLDDYFIKYPTFQRYYQKHIADKLKRHVQLPLQKGVIDTLWTNNNAESINHRIKQEIDWKPQKLLALIQCLDDISDAHFMDLRKSLYGRGNFVLCEEFRKHSVTPGEWAQKSANWKNKKMTNFLKMKKTAQAGNTLQSTDGRFAMPKSSGIAKKPGQRRRARAEKVKRQ